MSGDHDGLRRTLETADEPNHPEALRHELVKLLERRMRVDGGLETAIPALRLYRFSGVTEPAHALQQPGIYVVAQGRKQVTVGGETYFYDPSQYLVVSLQLPAVGRVVKATPEKPYLRMTLAVDDRELAALILETGTEIPNDDHDGAALYVSSVRAPLLDGFLRLVRLLDKPQDIPVLAPLVLREISYRLLQGEQFPRLAHMAIADSLRRVARAIEWIKKNYTKPVQIEALAERVHMSPSALHRHFKAATTMSPIQYQKRVRLQEARSRLVAGATSAEAVAYQVGYVSSSQFSREYARLFGQPPRRDAERLRDGATSGVSIT